MLHFLVHKIFTFYVNGVLNCKCPAAGPKDVLIVRCCDVIDSRWGKQQPTFRVESQCLHLQRSRLLQCFIFRNVVRNHTPNDTASCPRTVELSATPQRRPRNVPRVYSFTHRPNNAWQRPESAFFTQLTLNEPYSSNRTPLEAPSTERWAPPCCSPSRHACWTWRQATDCAIRRTIAGSFDAPYVKATGVGDIVTRLYVKTCLTKIHQSPQFVAQNCNERHQTEKHGNCSQLSRRLGSY